jgi:hypothetical protein
MNRYASGTILNIRIIPNQYSIFGLLLRRAIKTVIRRTLIRLATIAPTIFETCVDSAITIKLHNH